MRLRVLSTLVMILAAACEREGPSTETAPPVAPDADAGAVDAAAPEPEASVPDDLDRLEALLAALGKASDDAAKVALVEAFVHAVSYGEGGFPIRARGKIAFVWWDRDRRVDPVAAAGDFNGWSTTASPLTAPAPGFPFFVRIEDDPAPSGRSLYKLVRGASTWLPDPLARRYGYDENGEYSLVEAGRDRGHLERWPAFGEARGTLEARTLAVWVPPTYDPKTAPGYPLLVMHDAQNVLGPGGPYGSWHADATAEAAVLAGEVRPFVIVAIPNTTQRFAEYTHVTDTIPDVGTAGGSADAYVKFVADGIVPFVRGRYAIRGEPSQTAVLGSSLGGLVSLYIGLRRPALFGYAGSMSGTMSWGSIGAANPTIRDLYVAKPPFGLSVYLDSGGDDGGGCAALSALESELHHDQYCETLAMRDTLVGLGWALGKDLAYTWSPGAAHDEAAWAARLPALLRTWFPRR